MTFPQKFGTNSAKDVRDALTGVALDAVASAFGRGAAQSGDFVLNARSKLDEYEITSNAMHFDFGSNVGIELQTIS